MSVVVTGAAGFIGTNLCKKLLEEKHSVIGIDNGSTGSKQNVAFLRTFPSFSFFEVDTTDPRVVTLLLSHEVSAIYDLAMPTGVENLLKMPLAMLRTSTLGVQNMLEVALQKRCPMLYASSSEIYGDPTETPQNEEYAGSLHPLHPRAAYAEGKRCAESFVAAYHRTRGVDVRIARIFNTYGPYFSESDHRVIPRFLRCVRTNQNLPIHGSGEQKRSFLYIDDLLEGFTLLMNQGVPGEAYNIGSEELLSINDLAQMILTLFPCSLAVCHHPQQTCDLRYTRQPDLTKVATLGWHPRTSLTAGLKKCAPTL